MKNKSRPNTPKPESPLVNADVIEELRVRTDIRTGFPNPRPAPSGPTGLINPTDK